MSVLHVRVDENGAHVKASEFLQLAGFENTEEKRTEVIEQMNRIMKDRYDLDFAFAYGDGDLHVLPEVIAADEDGETVPLWKDGAERFLAALAQTIRSAFAEAQRETRDRLRFTALIDRIKEHAIQITETDTVYEASLSDFSMEELHWLLKFIERHPPPEHLQEAIGFFHVIYAAHVKAHQLLEQERREAVRAERAARNHKPQVEQPTPRCSVCSKKPAYTEGKCKKCLRAEGLLPAGKIT